jgi:hypothetical protein
VIAMTATIKPSLQWIMLGIVAVLSMLRSDAAEPDVVIVPGDFSSVVTHPLHPLLPGMKWQYFEKKGRDETTITMGVQRSTKDILGVKCITVFEQAKIAGVLKEESRAWYAQHKDGSVWFFGEAITEFKPGNRVSDLGSWQAGIAGAKPGVVMPGKLAVGLRFRQNYCRNIAEDRSEIIALGETVKVPAGEFKSCLRMREWSMLASGSSKKWYAKDVGLVRIDALDGETTVLVSFTKPQP